MKKIISLALVVLLVFGPVFAAPVSAAAEENHYSLIHSRMYKMWIASIGFGNLPEYTENFSPSLIKLYILWDWDLDKYIIGYKDDNPYCPEYSFPADEFEESVQEQFVVDIEEFRAAQDWCSYVPETHSYYMFGGLGGWGDIEIGYHTRGYEKVSDNRYAVYGYDLSTYVEPTEDMVNYIDYVAHEGNCYKRFEVSKAIVECNGKDVKFISFEKGIDKYSVPETKDLIHNHNVSKWTTDKKATVNGAGKKHGVCTLCGETITEKIPQLKCSKPKFKSIENTEYGVLTKWSKVSGADKYRVYRKTSKSDWKYIGTTSKTYYTDKTAKSGTKYYYAVKAQNETGNSSLSNSLSKYYLADPTLKTPSSTKSGISLKWTKTAGAQGYVIYRKTGSGSYTKLKTEKGISNLSYVDKSAKKGNKYTYKVKAYYSKTYSAYSNTKTIKDKY